MKIDSLLPLYIETIPDVIEEGILYISRRYGCSQHVCCCGCREVVNLSLKPDWDDGWELIEKDKLVSITPSILNRSCRAHYFITNNKVKWA